MPAQPSRRLSLQRDGRRQLTRKGDAGVAQIADTPGMDANAAAATAGQTGVWADPSTLSDGELTQQLRRCEGTEKTLSRRRSVLHDRIDFLRSGVTAEIYAAGDQLEVLQARERQIAEERRLLHERIDALRAERGKRRTATSTH